MKTKLQHINDVDESDFGIDSLEYQMLVRAYDLQQDVDVLECAIASGSGAANDYFDIQLENGLRIDAISGYHLVNIENYVDLSSVTTAAQFAVEIQYKATAAPDVTSAKLKEILQIGIQNALDKADIIANCTLVQFETTYNI